MATESRMRLLIILFFVSLSFLSIFGALYMFSVGIAAKGSYVVVGATIVLLVEGATRNKGESLRSRPTAPGRFNSLDYAKLITSIYFIGISVALLSGGSLVALVAFLFVGYYLIYRQLKYSYNAGHVVYQICLLGSLMPIYKFSAAGFYFGGGDLIGHVQSVERILLTGQVNAILDAYVSFPNYHILVASISTITTIGPYENTMILGILSFLASLLVLYRLSGLIGLSTESALFTILATSGLAPIMYNITHFIPRSAGLIYAIFILYLLSHHTIFTDRRSFLLAIIIAINFGFTHHFSALLFGGILFIAYCVRFLFARLNSNYRHGLLPSSTSVLAMAAVFIVYWTWTGRGFIWSIGFVFPVIIDRILSGFSFASSASSSTSSSVVTFDSSIPTPSTTELFLWIVSPEGLYNTLLVVVFIFGVLYFWFRRNQFVRSFPMVVSGFLGFSVLFKTVFNLKSLSRLQSKWAILSAFAAGFGLFALYRLTFTNSFWRKRLVVGLILVFLISGQVAAANDVYQVRPDLSQEALLEHEFDHQEYNHLQMTGGFLATYRPPFATFWSTRLMLDRFIAVSTGVREAGKEPIVRNENITVEEGLFVYNYGWVDHRVAYRGGLKSGSFIMSERWLNYTVTRSNKMYTTGSVGALWEPDNHVYGH